MKIKTKSILLVVVIVFFMLAAGIGIPYALLYFQNARYIDTEQTLTLEIYPLNREDNSSEEHLHKSIRLYSEDNLTSVSKLPSDHYNRYSAGSKAEELLLNILHNCYAFNVDGTLVYEFNQVLNPGEYSPFIDGDELSAYLNTKDASIGYWAFEGFLDLTLYDDYQGEFGEGLDIKIILDGLTGNWIFFEIKLTNGYISMGEYEMLVLIATISPVFDGPEIEEKYDEDTNTHTYIIDNYSAVLQIEEQSIKYEMMAT